MKAERSGRRKGRQGQEAKDCRSRDRKEAATANRREKVRRIGDQDVNEDEDI